MVSYDGQGISHENLLEICQTWILCRRLHRYPNSPRSSTRLWTIEALVTGILTLRLEVPLLRWNFSMKTECLECQAQWEKPRATTLTVFSNFCNHFGSVCTYIQRSGAALKPLNLDLKITVEVVALVWTNHVLQLQWFFFQTCETILAVPARIRIDEFMPFENQ